MKLELAQAAGHTVFTGYGPGYVEVNKQRYEHSLVLAVDGSVQNWAAANFETLAPADFEALLAGQPEIIIFGTGEVLRFPRRELIRSITAARTGFEVMDTKAACRTYNILVSEGRKVLAAILV